MVNKIYDKLSERITFGTRLKRLLGELYFRPLLVSIAIPFPIILLLISKSSMQPQGV